MHDNGSLRLSLSAKLLFMSALMLGALAVVVGLGWHALRLEQQRVTELALLGEAARHNQHADMLHDAMRAQLLAALLAGEVGGSASSAVDGLRHDAAQFSAELAALERLPLADDVADHLRETRAAAADYLREAELLGQLVLARRSDALARLPAFDAAFEAAKAALERQTDLLAQQRQQAQQASASDDARTRDLLFMAALATVVVSLLGTALVAGSVRRSIARLSDVASAIADGELDRRSADAGRDEVGRLGRSIDRMADTLQSMLARKRAEAERATFGRELGEAFDIADSEVGAHEVVARAMAAISPAHPMELLLADSSRAHLERAASHPVAGAPGCGVASPFACVAVRRGQTVRFDDSEALNACPQLRGRACGAVSAVCVPVSFMGRSLGVLHASGSVGEPLGDDAAQQLGILGLQAGGRIGMVRAFERTQTQASTDGLTGLPNRRTLEQRLRALTAGQQAFAFVLCDLDHFKQLNDRHGHQAGDDALRLFAEVLRKSVRDSDMAARWGGEEFAFVLAGSSAQQALGWTERVRRQLADELGHGAAARFTASFGIADSSMSRQPDQLAHLADEALYASKHGGRDRASIADPIVLAAAAARHASERAASVDTARLAATATD